MAQQSSPEEPIPVRTVSRLIGQWIDRLGAVWVEGQVTQITRRPGSPTVFLTLRDPAADVSVSVRASMDVVGAVAPRLEAGARIVVHARPEFYLARGSLTLAAREIRPVGVGALLARLEQLKATLAAEGLFAADRKRALPFLPGVVGLICGRGSAAEHDVLENARRRWPAVAFRVENVPVQGPYAVPEIVDALARLDVDTTIDVIVLARGGGSLEDLLPFSDETLIRAVSTCRTPVVSAIGHEQDSPLLDLVADARASTPTDAAKRVVPAVAEELALVSEAVRRGRRALGRWLDREVAQLTAVRSRPCFAEPLRLVDGRADEVQRLQHRAREQVRHRLDQAASDLDHTRARVRALSPQATLDRGYAVVTDADGRVVRAPDAAPVGAHLVVLLAEGRLGVDSTGPVDPDTS